MKTHITEKIQATTRRDIDVLEVEFNIHRLLSYQRNLLRLLFRGILRYYINDVAETSLLNRYINVSRRNCRRDKSCGNILPSQ